MIDKMGRFLIAFLTLPLSSPFTPHFSVRPLTRISKFAALIKKFFPQPPVVAYSLTRLILRRFELASHKGRGNCFVAIYSTVQLFNHSPIQHSSLFTFYPSPEFVSSQMLTNKFFPLPQGARKLFCSNPFNPSTLLTLHASHLTLIRTYRLISLNTSRTKPQSRLSGDDSSGIFAARIFQKTHTRIPCTSILFRNLF